mmetsp:Transcript_36819/g.72920  ORF Transcript_36819/g.72920 Transcript_36819/m.72920 type:complete len:441 (-) Transcript_36819:298-1620(-)
MRVLHSRLTIMAIAACTAHSLITPAVKYIKATTVLNVLGDRKSELSSSNDDFRKKLVGGSSFDIFDLLLQRSLQTQIVYFKNTRNDLKADWLNGFAEHDHLDGGARWHSIVGMRMHCGEYFQSLLSEPIHSITVRYGPGAVGVGSTKDGTTLKEMSDTSGVAPGLTPWLAASASRRKNPYLTKPKPMEFEEFVSPKELTHSLMGVCRSLAIEWKEDLALLASVDNEEYRREQGSAHRERMRAHRAKFKQKRGEDEERLLDMEAFEASIQPVPPFLSAERGRDGSSPLRRLSYELLERVVTVLALKALQADLAVGGLLFRQDKRQAASKKEAATLKWLDDFLTDGQWFEALAAVTESRFRADKSDVTLDTVSDRLFTALELRAPSFSNLDVVDPPALADALRKHREQVALSLASQVGHCDDVLQSVLRECENRLILERAVL